MLKVGVVGAGGRMGQEVCRAVSEASDLELVAAIDPGHVGADACGRTIVGEVNALADLGTEVVVDFTIAEAVRHNIRHYAQLGIHAVIGTSGLSEADMADLRAQFGGAGGTNAVVVPNFAIGAVLLLHLARIAAPHMDGVEIIELHHDAKRDAPSGTAMHTAAVIAEARREAGSAALPPDPTTDTVLAGARGGVAAGGVHVHSVRLPGLVAHEEVIFGAAWTEPDHPPRLVRPALLHAGRPGGRAGGARSARGDRGPRGVAGAVNPEVRERLLQATYDCVARWGLAKTTIEDAAREAGVSRATVYRYFPGGRDELLSAVVGWEFSRFFLRLYEEVSDADTLEEVMERGLMFADHALVEHEVLQRVLVTEPDILLPRLSTEADQTHTLVAAFLAPYLVRHGMAEGTDLDAAADFLARMVLSYISSPGRWDLNDPDQVALLVRSELLAGIR